VRPDPPRFGLRGSIWNWFSAHADTPPVRVLRHVADAALTYLHAENHDLATNGEGFVLDCVAPQARTILDVGANRGDGALEAVRRCPQAAVHCFELASSTREELRRRVEAEPRIRVEATGLSSRAGPVRVKHYPGESAWTSIYDYPHDEPSGWTDEVVTTGDAFLAVAGLTQVDLLKIDTEGSELAVLQGFRAALERQAIRVIQFEYGYAAVVARALLIDFYELLGPLGYVIGRLRRAACDFAPYSFSSENFFGPNFVAVRGDDELVARLAGRSR
jgi:FkbM family methyltransferase